MKYINILRTTFILAIVAAGLGSCKKWLDVSPKITVKEADQFASAQGFYDALFGSYQKLSEPALYGAELSYGLLDILAQRYENKLSTDATYGKIARYDYLGDASAGGKIISIWNNMYAVIAQCNFILQNTENGVMQETDRRIVKGEALAMRAYLHFDLLRLFGLAYLDGANGNATAIPYMDKYQVVQQERMTVEGVLAKCEQDLKAAEELLSASTDIDRMEDSRNNTSNDINRLFRQNHLNYWAVKATLARLYLYKGNKQEALRYAKEVIDGKKFQFVNPTSVVLDPASGSADMTFSSEHIFSVYTPNLKTRVDEIFVSSSTMAPDATDLFSTRPRLNTMYEVALAGHGTDIRSPSAIKTLWNQLMPAAVYTRKYYNESAGNVRASLIPAIRLPEMYYIAAEASGDLHDGVTWLNLVRVARLIPALPDPPSEAVLQAEIEKEYRKEFYAEGQLWFYYKRVNKLVIPDGTGVQMAPSMYVFPYPTIESGYGK